MNIEDASAAGADEVDGPDADIAGRRTTLILISLNSVEQESEEAVLQQAITATLNAVRYGPARS